MISGRRLAAGVLLVALGTVLLVVARPSPALEKAPPQRPATSQLSRQVDATADSWIAAGKALRPQWLEFRPSRLALDSTGIAAPVDPVSVDHGTLALPEDADRVGWWRGGSLAGAPFGTALLAGHLDSDADPAGYLAGLADLVPGDLVELSGEGDRLQYRVTRNYLLPRADLSAHSDLFEQQHRHRLVLITCGGPYDVAAGRYQHNRVVVALPTVRRTRG